MSIHAIAGKPGGGKTYFAMRLLEQEVKSTRRWIVTNLPIKQADFAEYLQKKYGDTFFLNLRLVVLDYEQTKNFWLHRGGDKVFQPKDDHEYQFDYTRMSAENFIDVPRADGSFDRIGGGVWYCVDEIHLFFNSREWQKTGKGAMYYLSQHRKAGDTVIWISQFIQNVEKQFRSLTQDFTYVRNFSKEKLFSFFRSFPFITYSVFQDSNNTNASPTETGRFNLDLKGLCLCYDTSAGVGLAGAAAADTHEQKKGLPFWFLPAAAMVAIGLLIGAAALLQRFVAKRLAPPQAQKNRVQVSTSGAQSVVNSVLSPLKPLYSSSTNVIKDVPPPVYYTGYIFSDGVARVFLSNGKTFRSDEPGLNAYGPEYCVINGQRVDKPPIEYGHATNVVSQYGSPTSVIFDVGEQVGANVRVVCDLSNLQKPRLGTHRPTYSVSLE